jgi:hypothetical protein
MLAWPQFQAPPGSRPGSDPGDCEVVRTANNTDHWVWVTIQDLGKTRNLDYGYVAPCSTRRWKSGGYTCGAFFHLRAEIKQATGRDHPQNPPPGDPPNIYDTRMQINPQSGNYNSQISTLYTGDKGNFYWKHGPKQGMQFCGFPEGANAPPKLPGPK